MRKSERIDFMGLYGGILADIALEYPNDARDWIRDKSHLQSILDQDGLGFVTLVLPAAGKHLDRCLSNGFLTPFRMAHLRAYRKGSTIPGLFRALYFRIFEQNGILRSSPDIGAIRFLRQLLYAAKKVEMPCAETANYSAVQAFWTVEKALKAPTLSWDLDVLANPTHHLHLVDDGQVQPERCQCLPRTVAADHSELQPQLEGIYHHVDARSPVLDSVLERVQRVADLIAYRLGEFDPLAYRPKHGPGAVSDLRKGADKYSFPRWPDKLEGIFSQADFAYANYRLGLDSGALGTNNLDTATQNWVICGRSEGPSMLHAVPKTLKGPRLIAAEPTSHQWCQQVVKEYLVHSVRTSVLGNCIDFRRQDLSQKAALQASHTGRYATVDLSDASDRLSCWLVERLFRSRFDLLEAFHACRTRWIKQLLDKKVPSHIVLRKFSTMGSALTFPVQSIVFTMIAIGVRIHMQNQYVDAGTVARASKEVRVFGDDIICRSEDVEVLSQVLSYLGLKVNTDKTFWNGKFRESCGVDAYDGIDVTPAYVVEVGLETRPNVVAARVDTSNNFFLKGYWRTSAWLVSTIAQKVVKNLPVMPPHVGGLSLSSYCGRAVDHLKKRWNHDLHRWEFKYLSSRSRVKSTARDNPSSLLQYFTERPEADGLGVLPDHPLGVQGRPQVHLHLRWGGLEV